ncbi:MAG TPA: FkbM family methyltransferase [Dokdonella sp.]
MRLLQLTTYPLKNPRHGGQLRCAAIRDCYRALGIEVETLAVMHEGAHRGDRERSDIALPAESPHWNPRLPRFVDLQAGDCLVGSAEAFAAFDAVLGRLRPHVIQLEQPWLYPAVKRWLDERAFDERTRPRLVYSSQNIEWKLKRDEAATGVATAPDFAREVRRVEALEREVVRAADLVIACTDEELSELRAMTDDAAGTRTWVTAHNAIAPYNPDPARVAAMRHRLGLERYPLFVGSAHPPNVDGFWRMLAPSLSFLRPDEKIVVAGSVGHLLRQHPTYAAWSGINEPRLAIVGEVEREDLVALLGGAAAILLPITTGGGSNLKTAEAIYSGRPVLATPHALRGYGDAAHWPTIRVEDGADGFRRTLRALLDAAPSEPPAGHARIRDEVTWTRALEPLAHAISAWSAPARHAPATIADPSLADTRTRIARIDAVVQRKGGIDYEALLERQYTRLLRAGDTVVDIGAHAGRHLARFLDCVGPSGMVHGFEPLPAMHARLAKTFHQRNVRLHPVALTDTTGRIEFVFADGAPEESGLRQRVYNNPAAVTPTRIEVEARMLDQYAGELDGLRFIKIDVEGAELNVLRGARAVLAAHRPVVSVEYGRPAYGAYGHDTFTLFDFAEAHGYAMYDIFAHRLDREAWGIACDSVYWDYFMVPLESEASFAQAVPPLDPDAPA